NVINASSGELAERARRFGTGTLSVGLVRDQRTALAPALSRLAGAKVTEQLAAMPVETREYDIYFQAYTLLHATAPLVATAPISEDTTSEIDPRTMLTTVTVKATATGDPSTLPAYLDPQNWDSSAFWRASYLVK